MKQLLSLVLCIGAISLGVVTPAFSQSSGEAGSDDFKVRIKKDILKNEAMSSRKSEPVAVHEEVPGDSAASAMKLIQFKEHKNPEDKRARLAEGASLQTGSYCLASDGTLGTMGVVPADWGDGSDTPYYNNGVPLGCIALNPDELEGAGLELVEVNGEMVVQPIRIQLTVEDLQSFPITPADAHQERAPHTLKNYNTNFWADASVQEFQREIAGQQVQVRATPVSYSFVYGDGGQLGPVSYAGYQLGEDVWDEETPTSHKYTVPGDYQFSVVTGYRGEFSVDGGPWEVIDGTVERPSEGQLVRVWRTQVGLVADDCSAAQGAWGCTGTDR
ncbi:hypothetical protein GCM10023352_07960 [Rothia endophytica]|uniref:PKD domain-containing protein n=2 Tax=Rothia endophytica TaxID=1324766 RepID=A0ABP9B8I7_9MICC